MTFTREDLKQLKEGELHYGPHSQYPKGFLLALIDRLEAGEALIEYAAKWYSPVSEEDEQKYDELLTLYYKAGGK